MDLAISDKKFIVTGASSGFGKSVSEALIREGAQVTAIARRNEKLEEFKDVYPDAITTFCGDVTQENTINEIVNLAESTNIQGIFINAGGPPAGNSLEVSVCQIDEAYRLVLRWKIELLQKLMPYFKKKKYGRIVLLESSSIKQPIENLSLSNTFRMAVAGYMKTLSAEIASCGITINIIAPGFHETDAVKRIYTKKAELSGKSEEAIKNQMIQNTPVQKIGNPDNLASLATWLLSPKSEFVTGQIYTLDGGAVKGNL